MPNPENTARDINNALAKHDPRVSVAWAYGVDAGRDPVGFAVYLDGDDTPFSVEDNGSRFVIDEHGVGELARFARPDRVAVALVEFIKSWVAETHEKEA